MKSLPGDNGFRQMPGQEKSSLLALNIEFRQWCHIADTGRPADRGRFLLRIAIALDPLPACFEDEMGAVLRVPIVDRTQLVDLAHFNLAPSGS